MSEKNPRQYSGHLYRWTKQFDSVNHHWELRSVHGGIHFHVSVFRGKPVAGLEYHSIYPQRDIAPDHINCPITGGRCWHDGTSLYAMDHLWPMIEPYLKHGEHEQIFSILEREATHLEEYSPSFTRTDD